MQASRGQRRHHLIFYLEIRDRGSNEPLGFLSNITPDGMQVLSERPLAVGKSFELEICRPGMTRQPVRCRARSIWSKADTDPGYYATGFQFEDIPAMTLQAIERLIRDLGFDS